MDGGINSQSFLKWQKVDFSPDETITHLAAGRNHVAIATKDKTISIITTNDGKQIDCDLNSYLRNKLLQVKIYRIFLDPTGKFLLISLASAPDNQPFENLLFVKRLQSLPRLKNHLISSVAWNYPRSNTDVGSDNSTGTILLGTNKGLILQAEFVHSDESKFFPLSTGLRQYVKEVFEVGPELGAVTGIEYHQVPSNNPTERSYIIFISTNGRLYRMIGSVPANVDPPPLNTIFVQNATNYKDVPGRFFNSKLDLFYPSYNSPPIRYAWLTEPGVMTGEIHNQMIADRSAFESSHDMTTISYESPEEFGSVPQSASTPLGLSPSFSFRYRLRPISIVTTNFHVIIVFKNNIKAIRLLDSAIVYDEYLPNRYGEIHGIAKDPAKNNIWLFCDKTIFKYKVINEYQDIWRIYLDQKRFDLAKKYSLNDESNYDRVLCEEAQHYFKLGEYDTSAELFAKSRKPFEVVASMFMEINTTKANRKYLLFKLEQTDPSQTIQITMSLGWLLELIISEIAVGTSDDDLQIELQDLVSNKQISNCFAKYSILFYGIIRNYSEENFVRVAKLRGDFSRVVGHYMELCEYSKALDIMRVIKQVGLFYTYGHILMKKMPKELVDPLMEQETIKPWNLIPVLIQENPFYTKCAETIRYLEFCINVRKTGNRDIYNYLFELYASHRDEDTLLEYLRTQIDDGNKRCQLDLQLCFRLCMELGLLKTCVALYSAMGQYDEAVELALSFDIELAKSIAIKPNSDKHQKCLWLMIAKRALTNNLDIQIATGLLSECPLLKIEDILPFFPDYTTIDYFRDAIRHSLKEYTDQIMSLKDGAYEKIESNIRTEIRTFRNRYSIIKLDQRCEICSRSLLSQSFYVFPCGHLFHRACIIKKLVDIDPDYKGIDSKLKQLGLDYSPRETLIRDQIFLSSSVSSQSKGVVETRENIENELEDIIANECIYCGSLLPNYIQKPPVLKTELDCE